MAKAPKNAISPTREADYPEWYQQVIKAADLAEVSPVRGCMVIKPWGWGIWENMQKVLDGMFKETGHENAYFPLFIPMSFLEKEAEHVEGFAKECAVVTHHRLEPGPDGGLVPAGKLDEPLIVRPTSETIIGAMYAKWVQSYRDLPILINQWANVVRWELRTRMFLRTAEFLWQEGHTAHATKEEALFETRQMLDVYADFAENYMAMPVIKGEKPSWERFPGADMTVSIEAMMQDRKALQAGTSHFLGQNFSKAQEIKFQSAEGTEEFAWTTSWGVSTRLVGGLIMTHSDDDGLVIPPRLAPKHIVILPIYRSDEEKAAVLAFCNDLEAKLKAQSYDGAPVRVMMDDRDLRGGEKTWYHIKRGVPVRVEVGPRDVASGSVFVGRRDKAPNDKQGIPVDQFVAEVAATLTDIQNGLFEKAKKLREDNSRKVDSLEELKKWFTSKNDDKPEIHGGFAFVHCADAKEVEEELKKLKLTARCIPVDGDEEPGKCLFTGQEVSKRMVIAKAY
ncbi:proline--tRNA ligase [Blastopirellula marina]|uniref:Proline--tRNA ligase n=1 Tax=Blastopirellula marina TaxID=124 RepID=A0A2S8F455_9BACT|nr:MULTISPECIES: proline--tRNA ligase [Pirellulaceae]PQO26942.1 proline--tRNA ligase [Blastopirellula marina]RCS46531.1 proline--tRNA ligase [Bremerella cremea]